MNDLDAFLRWNSGHLLENRTRVAYAEWLVHRAFGLDPGEHCIDWTEVDVTDGAINLEGKSAAYVQSWPQEGTRVISFPIAQRVATQGSWVVVGGAECAGGWGGAVVVTGRLTIPTADGEPLHYSAVASEPLESKSQAPAAEVAASACLRRAAAIAGLKLYG